MGKFAHHEKEDKEAANEAAMESMQVNEANIPTKFRVQEKGK